jgi:hypothetical protein
MRSQSLLKFALLLAFVTALAAGCSKNSNKLTDPTSGGASGSSVEQAGVQDAMTSEPTLVEDGVYDDEDPASLGSDGGAALLHPLRYWRHITSVQRTFDFAFSDTDSTGRPTRALVTIRKYMHGTFNILNDDQPDSIPPDTATTSIVRKRLGDLWERHVALRRVLRSSSSEGPEWRIAGVSGVSVSSFHGTDMSPVFGDTHIRSVRIQSASGDTMITDPLAIFTLRRLPAFQPGEDVTLTVRTLRNDDVVVLVRGGDRRRFHNNGDNTYTLFWHTSAEDGVHHVGVNALSHGTLFDDAAPYDSQAWLFPYIVFPTQLAELMP